MKSTMNQFLSDLVVEYHKLQSFHWYVKGPDFFQAHEQLEEYYDGIHDVIDDVAEAMLMEGLEPVSKMADFIALTKIEEAPGTFVTSAEVFDAVEADFKHLLASAKAVKAAAEEAGSDLVAAKADGYIESFSKSIWMIGQSRR
ncbi:Dps family protein [Collinsella vaginalis]|uniref:Dps family protein n=1 Tax=Collinsella vaginalis TaxID=1870987 RepID=UPI000A26CF84|nr:DNA starvation/stationary phase protection protein [Collinsella vaginalis]